MEKMIKETIAVRIKPETKKKMEAIRVKTGLPYGAIFDMLIDVVDIEKTNYGFKINTPDF